MNVLLGQISSMQTALLIVLLVFQLVTFGDSAHFEYFSSPSIERKTSRRAWKWPGESIKHGQLDESNFFHLLKHKIKIHVIEKIPTTLGPPSDCICVPYYQCDNNNTIITDGIGIIDLRIRRCTGDLEVCCKLPRVTQKPSSMAPIVTTTSPPTIPPTSPPTIATSPPTLPPTSSSTTASTTVSTTAVPSPTPSETSPPSTSTTTTTPTPTTTTTPTPTTTTTTPTPTTTLSTPSVTLPADCICVSPSECDANGVLLVSGEGIINPRQTLLPCGPNKICCRLPSASVNFPTPPRLTTAAPSITNTCSCVKSYQCDGNGYIIISGAGNINPRFPGSRQGQIVNTCAADETCCRYPPNGQDSSMVARPSQSEPPIQYPSNTVNPGIEPMKNISDLLKNPGTSQECLCVKTWSCTPGFAVTIDGAGVIDPRFGFCMVADQVCCKLIGIIGDGRGISVPMVDTGKTLIVNPGSVNYGNEVVCGIRRAACTSASCASPHGDTYFGEFPWMVALLIKEPGGTNIFQCGASIINFRAVLTAAHCVLNRKPGLLVARFGEWNTANNNEPSPFQEADVQSIVTHPNYYAGGLYHDIAVLILATPISYSINVIPICLPQQTVILTAGTRCLASGWGRSGFEGQYQTVLKKVDLPLIERNACQSRLRETRLGQYFQLHGSFLCAGGEASKDTCTGDGGGPLVCPTASGQFIQVGIISWGIGCGQTNIPAVYVDVAQHRQWIDQQLANYGVS